MVNEEVLGGLISALSRGEPLHKAMYTLYNAGYKKEEIEEAARLVNSQPIEKIMQDEVRKNKEATMATTSKKQNTKSKNPQKVYVPPVTNQSQKKEETAQEKKKPEQKKEEPYMSDYKEVKNPEQFNRVLDQTINSLVKLKSPVKVLQGPDYKPPIIIQHVSDYYFPRKKTKKFPVILLLIILFILVGLMAAVFFFKDRILDLLSGLGF